MKFNFIDNGRQFDSNSQNHNRKNFNHGQKDGGMFNRKRKADHFSNGGAQIKQARESQRETCTHARIVCLIQKSIERGGNWEAYESNEKNCI